MESQPNSSPPVSRMFSRLGNGLEDHRELLPLSAFFSESALVVLGEPGMGKTTCFKQAVEEEENSIFLTIRAFLRQSNLDAFAGKTLYLDGLDEKRTEGVNGSNILDDIIRQLKKMECPRFRLSCRTADWYGELDKSNLQEASATNKVTVVRLEPLTDDQVKEIVEAEGHSGLEFLDKARQLDIEGWLTNPQSLQLLLTVLAGGNAWPETRTTLFETACAELVKERNEEHYRANQTIDHEQLLLASGLMCAIILRAELGIAMTPANEEDNFPDLHRFSASDLPIERAVRTKLFQHPAPERAIYYHRKMAEFLAARYLVHRMNNGLPADRVRGLLTTANGCVPTHLRGLHAWIVTLSPEPTVASFIQADPLGVLLYGDPASLSPSRRAAILDGLAVLGQENPWFLGDHWNKDLLGRLSDPAMQKRFEEILLTDINQNPHFVFSVLSIICHGKNLIVSPDSILNFIRRNDIPNHFSVIAAEAFIAHCPEHLKELLPILYGLGENPERDDGHELRAVLLKALYPLHLPISELMPHLPKPSPSLIGRYFYFLSHELVKKTPNDQLPDLMDLLLKNKQRMDYDQKYRNAAWRSLVCDALIISLEQHGDHISVEKLYEWFGVAIDQYGRSFLMQDANEHVPRFQVWWMPRPEKIKELFILWISRTTSVRLRQVDYYFWARLVGCPTPSWFQDWCLELALIHPDEDIANNLFQIGAVSLLSLAPEHPYPLDRLFTFVAHNPRFQALLDSLLYHELDDDCLKYKISEIEYAVEQEKIIIKNTDDLTRRIDGIRSGTDLVAIFYLADIYHGKYYNVDENASPRERLIKETTPEIALAAEQGFIQYGMNATGKNPQEIGQIISENKRYNDSWALLACMDLAFENNNQSIDGMSESLLESALCYGLDRADGGYSQWLLKIIEDRPELAARACQDFWLPQLLAGRDYVDGVHAMANEEHWAGIAQRVAIPILSKCQHLNKRYLKNLLVAALRWGNKEDLLELAKISLGQEMDQNDNWPLWAATAFLLDQSLWSQIQCAILQNQEAAHEFCMFIDDTIYGDDLFGKGCVPAQSLPISAMRLLVGTLGKNFPPAEEITPFKKGVLRLLPAMINQIGGETSQEASEALQSLVDDPAIQTWRNQILYTLANHRQLVADKRFEPLPYQGVFSTVTGGAPTTAGDLHALLVDQIRTIAREIRDGNTDGYKIFWNSDSHAKLTDPVHEEVGRDRLLEKLRDKLSPLSIHLEPEGHYANDNRADINVLCNSWKLPIEIKRHYHKDLWIAAEKQLIARYVRDPHTGGYGIYLVFWYGISVARRLSTPPDAIRPPGSPQELESALQETIPPDRRKTVCAIVMDVSSPQTS
ncbi:MAG: hypothetical protein H7836_09240 [Magnetococcus sp. YQC-3]